MSSSGFRMIEYLKKYNIIIDKRIITYLICVVVAAILWFLNALNKDYTAEIPYPVKYVNLPQGKHLVGDMPQTITLEVRAKGFALLRHRIGTSFLPITLNVNNYSNHALEKNDILEYSLNTNDIKDRISNQLDADIRLQAIYPETLDFRFSRSVSKKIAVRPTIRYTLKRQHILNKITADPDSIAVSGPSVIIDTLTGISTEEIELKDLSKNITKTTSLVEIPGCTFTDVPVEVNVQVEQFTEARKNITITEINVPDSLTLRLFPNYISVTYDVGLSNYDKISDKDFIFTVDYKQAVLSDYLDIKNRKIPAGIKNLTYTPQKVEYIIERK